MKKIIDKKILLFLFIIAGLGLIFGILFIFLVDKMDKLIIKTEITEYINLITNKTYNIKNGIINEAISNLIIYSLIFISSVIFVLFPIVLFIDFYIYFTFGFMISAFVYSFKIKGLVYLLYLSLPFKILNLFLILIFIMFSIRFSKKVYLFWNTNEDINIKVNAKKFLIIYLLFLIISVIINILETYLSLFLLNL